MLSRTEKQKIIKKYQRLMEPACRQALIARYGADQTGFYWDKVVRAYSRILEEMPDIGGEKNGMSHNLYQAAWAFALYEVLNRMMSREELLSLTQNILKPYMNLLRKVPGRFLIRRKLLRSLLVRRMEQYQRKLKVHLHRDWHNTWGMEVYRDTDEGVHFGLRGCPIYDYCKGHNMMTLLPYLCNLDHLMLNAMQLYLIRPTTCSNGDPVCDYIIVADNSPLVKKYPIVEVNGGLLLTQKG